MPARDAYAVLGVKPTASDEEIRRAYRALARSLHPDANPDPSAQSRFAEAAEAYQHVGTPEARRAYDRTRRARARPVGTEGEPPAGGPHAPHYTWTNIATDQSRPAPTDEFDRLYNAFFTRKPGRDLAD